MNLPTLSHDKAMHVVYGGLAAAVCAAAALLLGGSPLVAADLAMAGCTAVGLGKELLDQWTGRGTPEAADVAATIAGGLLVCAPLALSGVQ